MQSSADQMQGERRHAGLFKTGQSGNPSGSIKSKRYLALRADIVGDLGGEDALSGFERVIVDQVVCLVIRSQRVKNADDAVRCANSASRLLATLRSKRDQREPATSLRERLAAEAEQVG